MTKRAFANPIYGTMLLLWWLGTGLVQAEIKSAADNNPTAYDALRLVSKTLGRETLERVVEVTGHDGVPQPYLWKIVLKEGTGAREIDVAGGKIGSQRTLSQPPASDAPIHFADLNLDSSGAFDATDTQARKVKLRYDSLDYDLSVNSSTGKPIWHIDLIDKGGSPIGAIRLAAHDGTVLSTGGRLANNPPASSPTPAAVVHHPIPEPTPRVVDRPSPTPHERTVAATTTVIPKTPPLREPTLTTTTTTTTYSSEQRNIPVATLSDREDERPVAPPPPPPEGEGGLFTRVGRTLDHSTHAVKHRIFKDGATVQRFFTGHTDIDPDTTPSPVPPVRD